MEGSALEPVFFDPLRCPPEHVFPVVIEAEHERAVHLDAIFMQQMDAPRIIAGLRLDGGRLARRFPWAPASLICELL